MKCKILDCEERSWCKSMCMKHYYRIKRNGILDLPTPETRFWEKVNKNGPNGCWIWEGTGGRYGTVTVKCKGLSAHRLSWIMKNGPISEGLSVCHKCDTPRCVNPDHLFLGSHEDNMQDMVIKGRSAKGSVHGNSKMTEEKVLSMRQKHAEGTRAEDLAEEFGIGRRQVDNILKRRQWTHI